MYIALLNCYLTHKFTVLSVKQLSLGYHCSVICNIIVIIIWLFLRTPSSSWLCQLQARSCRSGCQRWLKAWSSMKCSVMGLPTNWTSELWLTLSSGMTPSETIKAQLVWFNCRDSILVENWYWNVLWELGGPQKRHGTFFGPLNCLSNVPRKN